ncbi:hypothetical protein NST54_15685 [Caldifermentibacillus hisashii]
MVTRTGLAAKIELFPTQNGDEKVKSIILCKIEITMFSPILGKD